YSAEEVIEKKSCLIFHDEDEIIRYAEELTNELGISVKAGFEIFTASIKTKNITNHCEWTFIKKDGSRIPVLLSVSVLINNNIIVGYVGVLEHAWSDGNSRLFNHSLSLMAITSFEGYFKKLNPAWQKTLGWPTEELLNKPVLDFIHPDDVQKTKDAIQYISNGHTVAAFENR